MKKISQLIEKKIKSKKLEKLQVIKIVIPIMISLLAFTFLATVEYQGIKILNSNPKEITKVVEDNRDELRSRQQERISKANYNYNVKSVNTSDYVKARTNLKKTINQSMIGLIDIPSIGIHLPIFSGMDNQAMLTGVGTLDPDRKVGQGNYVVMSHNLPEQYSQALLQPLVNLKKNEVIKISDFNAVYTYKVFYKQVVDQKKVGLLGQTEEPILTVFRCFGDNGTPNRLVVQAKLDKTEAVINRAISEDNNAIKDSKIKRNKVTELSASTDKEQSILKVFHAIYLTGNLKKDVLQFLITLIPLLFVLVMAIKSILRRFLPMLADKIKQMIKDFKKGAKDGYSDTIKQKAKTQVENKIEKK